MAETKTNKLGLQETKGSFQIKGVVTGTEKDKFYTEMTTKTNKPMRMINFGVNIENNKAVYVSLNGMEKDAVYFSKKNKEGKTITEKVAWRDRLSFKKDGFKPIGVNLGLTKVTDAKGNTINDKKTLAEYDACKYVSDNLTDDTSVFIRGKLEYSTYNDKHQTRFVPNQISLCKPIDFDEENFKSTADFEQVIVFTGIEKNENGSFTVYAKIITYNSVEDAEFIVENQTLAKNLRGLKPYTALKVNGIIRVEHETETVEEDDGWGTKSALEKVNNPTTRSLVITGADKASIDTTTYSEELIAEAIAKINSNKIADKDYGETSDDDGWGDSSSIQSNGNDDDDEWN